jgi:outer membrane protein OmpU
MKKILFATSALVGAAAFASSALAGGTHAAEPAKANAGALTVMVGGQIDFQASAADQDLVTANENDNRFANDTEIHVQASGSTENFDYGAVVELNADISDDADSDGGNADKAFIFVENDGFGRVELGGNSGASQTLEVDASNIARATGGIDGDFDRYVNTGAGTSYNLYPNLPVANDDVDGTDAQKITYYTPRFSGVQFGASYTPDTNAGSTTAVSSFDNDAGYSDVFAVGLNYEGQINENAGIEAAITGEFGDAELDTTTAREDLSAYQAGIAANFSGFSVAGSYGDLGESGVVSTATGVDQTFWTLGTAYENGPFGVSATYLDSTNEISGVSYDATNLVLGADYQLAPGFVPYVEASFFDLDRSATTNNDNSGNVILVGSELTF